MRAASTFGTHSRGGEIVMESGRPGEVLSNPQHQRTQAFPPKSANPTITSATQASRATTKRGAP